MIMNLNPILKKLKIIYKGTDKEGYFSDYLFNYKNPLSYLFLLLTFIICIFLSPFIEDTVQNLIRCTYRVLKDGEF